MKKYLSAVLIFVAHTGYAYLNNPNYLRNSIVRAYNVQQYSTLARRYLHRKFGLLSLSAEDDTDLSYPAILPSQIASNFGSDVLFRPEDEDSPEFREYLRQLLKMQVRLFVRMIWLNLDKYIIKANRAKAGHASPSSGSADAYVAKLTRLKIEKNARLRVGLPNVALDLSYKPEDYAAAV
jgi:hypothetical protein